MTAFSNTETCVKNVLDTSFSVREGRHTGQLCFLSVEALKLREGQLNFFKWNYVFFFR